MDTKAIGKFLLELRKEKSLTQKDIAKLCNVSAQAVSKWERGESIPDIELLDRLSLLYSISINEIVNGERSEIYIDVDRRTNIISLTTSILVFIAYLFTFAEIRVYRSIVMWTTYTFKGYEMIFNGISGWQVYLTWFVFVILISHLVLNIFIVSKVIYKKDMINYYFIVSSVIVILISLFGMAHELFFVFPQFIIFVLTSITLILIFNSGEIKLNMDKYRVFRNYKKTNNIPKDLMLTDDQIQSKFMKVTRILIISIISLAGLIVVLLSFGYMTELSNGYDNPELNYILVALILELVVGILLFRSYKYIGSIYTSQVLRLDAFLSFFILILGIFISSFAVFITTFILLIVPFLFIYGSFKFKKNDKK